MIRTIEKSSKQLINPTHTDKSKRLALIKYQRFFLFHFFKEFLLEQLFIGPKGSILLMRTIQCKIKIRSRRTAKSLTSYWSPGQSLAKPISPVGGDFGVSWVTFNLSHFCLCNCNRQYIWQLHYLSSWFAVLPGESPALPRLHTCPGNQISISCIMWHIASAPFPRANC